jgi:hypothetical protein
MLPAIKEIKVLNERTASKKTSGFINLLHQIIGK